MTYIVNSLAQYEVHVARYYYSRGAYVAAINRAQHAVTDYQDVPALEEALFILLRSYDALGMTQLRDDTRRVMEKTYPQSEYLTQGFKTRQDPWWKYLVTAAKPSSVSQEFLFRPSVCASVATPPAGAGRSPSSRGACRRPPARPDPISRRIRRPAPCLSATAASGTK